MKSASELVLRCMSTVKPEPITWLWPGKIACGKVTMIAGHPGLGKSQITTFIAAVVSAGKQWPDSHEACEQGSVAFLSAEDDAADTIRPRLEAAEADLSKVIIVEAVHERDWQDASMQRAVDLTIDGNAIENMLKEHPDLSLIIIDPITAYLGNTNSHKNEEVRKIFSTLGKIAANYNVAIVCISHLNKSADGRALMRITGSVAFVAAVRSAFIVASDKDNPDRRLFLPIKSNISQASTGLAFSIQSTNIGTEAINTSLVVWEDKPVEITADEALSIEANRTDNSALGEAKNFLMEILSNGPVAKSEIDVMAEESGYSRATIRRAQKALGIKATRVGFGENGAWEWSLPSNVLNEPIDAH